MLPSLAMSGAVDRLSSWWSQWTLSGTQSIFISIFIVVVVVVVAAVLCRVRRCVDRGARRSPAPVHVSSSSKTRPNSAGGGGADSWLRTVVEWAWSRSHVTWSHVAQCGVEAWMRALTEQAGRQSVRATRVVVVGLYCSQQRFLEAV